MQATINNEIANLTAYESNKQTIQEEIEESESAITELREELRELSEELDEKTKAVEQAKKVHNRSSKALDQVIKEIAIKVGLDAMIRVHVC